MKSILSKAVATIGLVSVMASSANAVALDNEIFITGAVSTTVVVGLVDVSGGGTNDTFVGADIDLGTVAANGTFAPQSFDVYVLTNNAAGVAMTITNAGAAGVLTGPGANIPVAYSLEGAGYTVDTTGAVTIAAGTSDGATSESTLVVTPAQVAVDQVAGTYTATLDVTVAAN